MGYRIKESLLMEATGKLYSVFGRQKSEVKGRKSVFQVTGFRFRIWNLDFRILFAICFLSLGIYLGGCSSSSSKPYDHSLVVTYAELNLFYEQEKLNNKETDSLYQVKVKEFFARKGLKQDEFKNEIDNLSEQDEAWKMFIHDVTTAMDSLKSIQVKKEPVVKLPSTPGHD